MKRSIALAFTLAVLLAGKAAGQGGNAWAWGSNEQGQLGDGGGWSFVPVQVSDVTGVVAVGGGWDHSLALKGDGTVWAWGGNQFGQLGDGANSDSDVPVQVTNLGTVAAIAAGEEFSLALKSDGTVWAWGMVPFPFGGRDVPVQVRNLNGVLAIGAGWEHYLAVGPGEIPATMLEPRSVNFGNQRVATSSAPQTITLTNSGAASMTIPSVSLQGVHPLNFTKTADNCSGLSLAAGGACTISVTFTPKTTGSKSAAFLVTSNAPRSPHLIPLSGTGTKAHTVSVLAPNGGEKLLTGNSFRIDWTASSGVFSSFDVRFSSNGGSTFTDIADCTGLVGGARSCTWVSPAPVTTAGRVQVIGRVSGGGSVSDNSDANFSIVSGTGQITVTWPNTPVKWAIGSDQLIKWAHNLGMAAFVKIEVSRDAGRTWSPITNSAPNTGSYLWQVTGAATTQGRVRVSWTANPAVKDISNVNFTIGVPFITVTKPNGGEQWKKGSTQTVTWTSNLGSAELVKIELSADGGATWLSLAEAAKAGPAELIPSTPSDGSQKVVLPEVTSTSAGYASHGSRTRQSPISRTLVSRSSLSTLDKPRIGAPLARRSSRTGNAPIPQRQLAEQPLGIEQCTRSGNSKRGRAKNVCIERTYRTDASEGGCVRITAWRAGGNCGWRAGKCMGVGSQ